MSPKTSRELAGPREDQFSGGSSHGIPSNGNTSGDQRHRIRESIDSADKAESVIHHLDAKSGIQLVPIAAVSLYCDGAGFLADYSDFMNVVEKNGCLHINLSHFLQLRKEILKGSSRHELKIMSKTFTKKSSRSHSKGGITITHIGNGSRMGRAWYYRRQINGKRIPFKLGRELNNAFKLARKIEAKFEAGTSLLCILKEHKPESKLIRQLEEEESSIKQQNFISGKPENISTIHLPEPSIQNLVDIYLEQAENPMSGYSLKTAGENVNQLRKVIQLGMGFVFAKNKTPADIKKQLFKNPISFLSPKIVDRFQEAMLRGDSEDYDDVDELERLRRSNSANSTLRQAKSLFSRNAMKGYRRADFEFTPPSKFRLTSLLSVADSRYSLPAFSKIEDLFSTLIEIRKKNPDKYLVIILGLFGGLRPGETKWLLKKKIQHSGYWKICIEVTKDFRPKKFQVRRIKIPAAFGRHLVEVARDNGSDFMLSGHKTYRTTDLFGEINSFLRNNYLPGVDRPCYELRKLFASASNVALGMDITHRRMGHKERSTTEKYYVDPDTTQELVDLFEEWAEKLFGGPAFEK